MKKTITISSDIWSKIKDHCDKNGLKIGKFIESITVKYLNNER